MEHLILYAINKHQSMQNIEGRIWKCELHCTRNVTDSWDIYCAV